MIGALQLSYSHLNYWVIAIDFTCKFGFPNGFVHRSTS